MQSIVHFTTSSEIKININKTNQNNNDNNLTNQKRFQNKVLTQAIQKKPTKEISLL